MSHLPSVQHPAIQKWLSTLSVKKNVCSILCKIEFWPFFSLVWVRNTCGCPGVSRGTCPKRLKLTFLFRHLRHLTGKSHFSVGQWPFQLPFFETQDALDGTCEDTQIPYFMFFHCCSWHNTHVKTRENEEGKSFFRKIISLLLELVSSFLSLSLSFVTWSRWKTWPPLMLLPIRQKLSKITNGDVLNMCK